MRNRSEPSQVAQAGFEPERIAVTQRVSGCYCAISTVRVLWRLKRKPDLPKKDRRKAGQNERTRREEHAD